MNYFCCDDNRRAALKGHPVYNGIDFLEVVDNQLDPQDQRQTVLIVHFINDIVPGSLKVNNVVILGGERITNIKVLDVYFLQGSPPGFPPMSPPDEGGNKLMYVKVNEAGDFSRYTLQLLQEGEPDDVPPPGYDRILSSVEFSFKVLCATDFDCEPKHVCITPREQAPEINYLAKDYASFKQLMLDRMSLLDPNWTERNPADIGIVLVELLAYAGDYLSYKQDAIATEAYLGTARRRISVRRHARLVDYFMHDGCNARIWAHIEVYDGVQNLTLPAIQGNEITKLLTQGTNLPAVFEPGGKEFEKALQQKVQVFELLHDQLLDHRHNEMHFYTWKQADCCLPKGATSATLIGRLPALKPGFVLILAEIAGPSTGVREDADPKHRQAVMLTAVAETEDPIGDPTRFPPDYTPIPVTNISWHPSDALSFPLCISSSTADGKRIMVSVAYGNNVMADHGLTIVEKLPVVPALNEETALQYQSVTSSSCGCEDPVTRFVLPRYRPELSNIPLTQALPYYTESKTSRNDPLSKKIPPESAFAAMQVSMRDVLPAIYLTQKAVTDPWTSKRDLLNSKYNDEHFVAETESGGVSSLRFGNGIEGKRPEAGAELTAVYRVGNGLAGNIGEHSLHHLVSGAPGINAANIKSVSNLLAAKGGLEKETMQSVRMRAPITFRRQERAVTLADYEDVSRRCSAEVQRSTASMRWTGSWRTVFLSVDRIGGKKIEESFEDNLRDCLEKYRMAGQDLEVAGPSFVSLEIEMTVCADPGYFKSDVKAALLDLFSDHVLPDGTNGVFHPDNFSFGQPVYLSPLYAAAQKTPGVQSVRFTKFQRQGKNTSQAIDEGKLLLNRLEIARLENDPNFPEHGLFTIHMQGGK